MALSILWWPGVGNGLADWLSVHFPKAKLWELIVSLLLVALGVVLGFWAVRREVSRQQSDKRAAMADWLGLPTLTARGADAVMMFSHGLARFDDRAVDAGIRGSARFGAWLARLGERRGEGAFDGATNQLAKGIDWAGQVARRAHTGQMHHYYTGIAAGLAAILIILSIGVLL